MGTDDFRAAVESAGKRHYAAAVAGDAAVIDELLADDVVYSHSNGARDDKKAYLARVAGGVYKGWTIDYTIDQIRFIGDAGDAAVVEATQVTSGPTLKGQHSVSLDVWSRRDGRWQLVAHHMTLVLAPEAWRASVIEAQERSAT